MVRLRMNEPVLPNPLLLTVTLMVVSSSTDGLLGIETILLTTKSATTVAL